VIAERPLPPASSPAASSPSSHPTLDTSSPIHLPPLSPRHQELLEAFTAARFDILAFTAAAKISSVELANFAAHPDIQAHIDALMDLARKSLHLRAAQARHTAINKLEAIAEASDDPIETRRAASQLLRATSASIVGSCHGLSASSTQTVRKTPNDPTPDEEPEPLPRPFAHPAPVLSAREVGDLLISALMHNYCKQRDVRKAAALATYAAFADHDATINDEPVSTDTDAECFESVSDSPLAGITNADNYGPARKPRITDTEATIRTPIAHRSIGDRTLHEHDLTLHLTRKPDSRHPGCWLVAAITIKPPGRSDPHVPR